MPAPIGLNTRSDTAVDPAGRAASSTSRVPARWLTPYALTGCRRVGLGDRRPGGTGPYSPAEPRRTSGSGRRRGDRVDQLRGDHGVRLHQVGAVPSRRPVQLTTGVGPQLAQQGREVVDVGGEQVEPVPPGADHLGDPGSTRQRRPDVATDEAGRAEESDAGSRRPPGPGPVGQQDGRRLAKRRLASS